MNEPIQFYSLDDIMCETGLSRASVYRYRHEITTKRTLSEPIPAQWPLEKPDALRFIEYIQKRIRKKT